MKRAIVRGRRILAAVAWSLAWLAGGPAAFAQQPANVREKGAQHEDTASPLSRQRDAIWLRLRYEQALIDRIRDHWRRPAGIDSHAVCRLKLQQIPGGSVISVETLPDCPYDHAARRSIEAAVLRSQPLPYAGYQAAFSRILILDFRAE
ncbi:MAG: TonB C-terminal domain-containing protein [Lysobacteraceae bacterium]